jgi:hypothetical protein
MAKIVTVRLSDEEYRRIAAVAKLERRPLSNLITLMVLNGIEEGEYVDGVEMEQILSDKRLMAKLQAGRRDAGKRKGKFVG